MLKDKIALITGASRGIGKAIAIEFAKSGAKIALNYSSSDKAAEEVAQTIRDAGGVVEIFKAQVHVEEEVNKMFSEIENKLGQIDILVNNAGITRDNLLIRMSEQEWDDVIDINLKGAFLCTKNAAKVMMKKRYGKIVNISSVVAFSGNKGQFNYSASKAGLIGMTKSAALELGARGIRVNAIAPGFITTDMTASLPEEVTNYIKDKLIIKEFGKVEDISNAAIFLASSQSDYITGQTIHVNGGMYL